MYIAIEYKYHTHDEVMHIPACTGIKRFFIDFPEILHSFNLLRTILVLRHDDSNIYTEEESVRTKLRENTLMKLPQWWR